MARMNVTPSMPTYKFKCSNCLAENFYSFMSGGSIEDFQEGSVKQRCRNCKVLVEVPKDGLEEVTVDIKDRVRQVCKMAAESERLEEEKRKKRHDKVMSVINIFRIIGAAAVILKKPKEFKIAPKAEPIDIKKI